MTVSDIRQLIATTLHELGLGDAKPVGERLLTQDRYYVGCQFDFKGVSAVWVEAAGQVRFFDDSGALLKIARLEANSGSAIVDQAA